MQTIYLDGPEGSAFYIIGQCLVLLQAMYPDKTECAEHARAFTERAKVSSYRELRSLVEEVTLGQITFLPGEGPELGPAVLDADITSIQMFGLLAMGLGKPDAPA